jgi:hypothetical protein
MGTYHQFWLRVVEATSILPAGEVVFCIHDDGIEFSVKASNTYCGVNEFVFGNSHRKNFKIYGA